MTSLNIVDRRSPNRHLNAQAPTKNDVQSRCEASLKIHLLSPFLEDFWFFSTLGAALPRMKARQAAFAPIAVSRSHLTRATIQKAFRAAVFALVDAIAEGIVAVVEVAAAVICRNSLHTTKSLNPLGARSYVIAVTFN